MKNALKNVVFRGYNCVVRLRQYPNGRHALELVEQGTGQPVAVASVNLPDAPMTDEEVAIKNWSENEGILKVLIEAGIVSEPVRLMPTGYVYAHICKLNQEIFPSLRT